MTENIRFSVVIAAYNAAGTIVRAVESCLDQRYPPHQVIVVDDASTDNTVALLEQRFGDRILLLRLERNTGPSAARNQGMDAATGDFIAFQDADDWWLPEKLTIVQTALREQPQMRFVFHRFSHSQESLPTHRRPIAYPLWKLLLRNVIATPCAVVVNDSSFRFDERFRQMEDWDFFLRFAERHGAWLLDAPLTVLGRPVLSPGGLSSSRKKMRVGEMRVYWKWAASRPLFLLLLPFLLLWSLVKATVKAAAGK